MLLVLVGGVVVFTSSSTFSGDKPLVFRFLGALSFSFVDSAASATAAFLLFLVSDLAATAFFLGDVDFLVVFLGAVVPSTVVLLSAPFNELLVADEELCSSIDVVSSLSLFGLVVSFVPLASVVRLRVDRRGIVGKNFNAVLLTITS